MSIAGIHLRLKNIEDCFTSSTSTKLTREDVEETAKNVFNNIVSTNDVKIAEELKTVSDKMCLLDNDLANVKTSLSSMKLTSDCVEETAKNVFDTLVSANEAKIAEELKTVTDKMIALDNELIAVKLSLSSITDEFVKKDDLSGLIEKIDKIEKIVDKISSKQDIIIKRIVVLEKKADSP